MPGEGEDTAGEGLAVEVGGSLVLTLVFVAVVVVVPGVTGVPGVVAVGCADDGKGVGVDGVGPFVVPATTPIEFPGQDTGTVPDLSSPNVAVAVTFVPSPHNSFVMVVMEVMGGRFEMESDVTVPGHGTAAPFEYHTPYT